MKRRKRLQDVEMVGLQGKRRQSSKQTGKAFLMYSPGLTVTTGVDARDPLEAGALAVPLVQCPFAPHQVVEIAHQVLHALVGLGPLLPHWLFSC